MSLKVCNSIAKLSWGRSVVTEDEIVESEDDPIIREIVELERSYFFEKRNVKTERQRKLREIIERHTKLGGESS